MRPGASPRWVLRTGKSGPASPGAYTAAGLRSPLSASFVCPAPWRLRQGLGGAGGDRRAQLARAQRPQRTGLGSARGLALSGRSPSPAAPPTSPPRASSPPLAHSLLHSASSLPPPVHLSLRPRLRSAPAGARPCALRPLPVHPTGKARLGPPPAPPIAHLVERPDRGPQPARRVDALLSSLPFDPRRLFVCLSIRLTLVSTSHLVSSWLPALCPAA